MGNKTLGFNPMGNKKSGFNPMGNKTLGFNPMGKTLNGFIAYINPNNIFRQIQFHVLLAFFYIRLQNFHFDDVLFDF
jgi:hypothetical protein